jgi:fucose permease
MKRNYFVVVLIMLIFVTISFVTNIWGSLIPDVQASFNLSLTLVGFIPTFLFLAYGLSIPVGMLAERFQAKPLLVAALVCGFLGCFLFAIRPSYGMALVSLFTIGIGFSMAQVIINPLLRVAGGEEHYAFFGNMSQLVFALGSAASPQLYAYLTRHLRATEGPRNFVIAMLDKVVTPGMPWISLYWVFTAMVLLMIVLIAAVRLPPLELNESEKVGSLDTIKYLFKKPAVWFYFIGIFCYVATEQGVSNWISSFLQKYHDVDPTRAAQISVSGFWGAMALGCAVSLVLLKLFDSRKILLVFMSCGVVTLFLSLFGSRHMAMVGLPAMGFWISVGWPLIFSLALNSLDKHHGSFAGILCTGIIGGAVMIPFVGKLGDLFGLRFGMLAMCITIGYMIFISLWAKPLVNNATIGSKKKTVEAA